MTTTTPSTNPLAQRLGNSYLTLLRKTLIAGARQLVTRGRIDSKQIQELERLVESDATSSEQLPITVEQLSVQSGGTLFGRARFYKATLNLSTSNGGTDTISYFLKEHAVTEQDSFDRGRVVQNTIAELEARRVSPLTYVDEEHAITATHVLNGSTLAKELHTMDIYERQSNLRRTGTTQASHTARKY